MGKSKVGLQMTAVGVSGEQCVGCDRQFERGERMNGVRDDEDEACGWFCDSCINEWVTKGIKSRPARRAAGLDIRKGFDHGQGESKDQGG